MQKIRSTLKNKETILNKLNDGAKIEIYLLKQPFSRRNNDHVSCSDIFLLKDDKDVFHISVEEDEYESPINELYRLSITEGAPVIQIINKDNIKFGKVQNNLPEGVELFDTVFLEGVKEKIKFFYEKDYVKDTTGRILYYIEIENTLLLKGQNKTIYISCSDVAYCLVISGDDQFIERQLDDKIESM
ncbi:hypothetical protein CU633_09945 [Bacillus sp. V3-13]|uniref:hypothetical protein n=1 Tax=Bacillus sp. V3-13 TaxID=2053728 RepID=UPI000C78EDFB|nr:hypothetical protein [Bacillus sp. V3-13]PLR77512.1 hypothetical protein CU633_09945 [Bacillus sp. V3-13]